MWDTTKKVLHFLSSVLLYSILAILIIIVLMFGAYFLDQKIGEKNQEIRQPLFGAYIIISPSMIPNINVYDAVVTMRVKEEKIEVNDIITFLSKNIETAGTPITHRVVGIVETTTGEKAYRTKGDNNNTPDSALILQNEVVGKVLFRIPMIGYLQTFLTKTAGWFMIVVLPCLIIVIYDVVKLLKTLIKKERPQDEQKKINDQQEKEHNNDDDII